MDSKELKRKWQEEILVSVHKELDDSYRHGNYVSEVFQDTETGKFWAVNYSVSGGGEQHGIRDGDAEAIEVTKTERQIVQTVIDWVMVK
jgi:hypothetical protein